MTRATLFGSLCFLLFHPQPALAQVDRVAATFVESAPTISWVSEPHASPALFRSYDPPGTHNHAVGGAVLGGLLGGIIVGQDMIRKPSQCQGSGNYGQMCAAIVIAGVASGSILGALIGRRIRHENDLNLSVAATPTGLSPGSYQLSARIRLRR